MAQGFSPAEVDFLVLEYLEGESLEGRLERGGLPLDAALKIGVEIADALTAAHRAGIVHRDLKPGNAMLTKSGAKLLDFGLAKAARARRCRIERVHAVDAPPSVNRHDDVTPDGTRFMVIKDPQTRHHCISSWANTGWTM